MQPRLESPELVSEMLKHQKKRVIQLAFDGANNARKRGLFHIQEEPSLPTGLHWPDKNNPAS